jgi:hypothetical protein
MLMKLGEHGQSFIDDTLPELVRIGAMTEIENRGGGVQRRFRLGVPLERLNAGIAAAHGSFARFLGQFGDDA